MVFRPYKCPLCHSAFRNESGMKWHLVHRHETPAAFDALEKKYEVENTSLKEENSKLKQKVGQLENELSLVKTTSSEEKSEKLEAIAQAQKQVQKLEEERDKVIVSLVLRDKILKDELNIELPNPLEHN